MRQQRRACQPLCDRPARRAGLEDGLALRARQLGSDGADDLEARRHVFQVLRDVGADAAQPTAAGRAAASLTCGVVMRGAGGWTNLPLLARQVRRQAAVDAAGIGRRRGGLAHRQLRQHHRFDETGLQIESLARGAELRTNPACQLQLELVDHQLEPLHLVGAGAQLLLEQLCVVGQLADRVDVLRHARQCVAWPNQVASGSLPGQRRHAANAGECVRTGMRQSMPSSSIDSWAAVNATRPSQA